MAKSRKVIITCAVTGSIHTPSMSPHLPVTGEEIADAAIGAAEAGAAIVHLHARNPKVFDDLYKCATEQVLINTEYLYEFQLTPRKTYLDVRYVPLAPNRVRKSLQQPEPEECGEGDDSPAGYACTRPDLVCR